jgi:hypothetical protein
MGTKQEERFHKYLELFEYSIFNESNVKPA